MCHEGVSLSKEEDTEIKYVPESQMINVNDAELGVQIKHFSHYHD